MESLDERSLTREAIVDFADSQARYWPNGALNAVYPNGDAKRDIPDYSEMFPEWVMRYYQLTGDAGLVGQVYPVMKRVADYIDAAIVVPQGLVYDLPGGTGPYQFGIIDWPAPMRYDTVRDGNGAQTVVNALGVGANRAVAQAAAVLAQPADAAAHGGRADALAAAMNAQLRNPGTGLYSDGLATGTLTRIESYSEHAQTYAIDYGIAPRSAYPALGDYLTSEGMQQGPMDLRQLEAALIAPGRIGTLVSLLTNPGADGPAKILAEGGTFMWEQWDPGCAVAGCTGPQVDQGSNESFSHCPTADQHRWRVQHFHRRLRAHRLHERLTGHGGSCRLPAAGQTVFPASLHGRRLPGSLPRRPGRPGRRRHRHRRYLARHDGSVRSRLL